MCYLTHPKRKVISNNQSTKGIIHENHERHERILLLFVLFVYFVDSFFLRNSCGPVIPDFRLPSGSIRAISLNAPDKAYPPIP